MLQTRSELQRKELDQRISLLTAGLAGIIAGAAGVTALALSDKDIRKKVGKRAREARHALQKWSAEKLLLLHDQEQKIAEGEEITEDVSQHHEEKLHN